MVSVQQTSQDMVIKSPQKANFLKLPLTAATPGASESNPLPRPRSNNDDDDDDDFQGVKVEPLRLARSTVSV